VKALLDERDDALFSLQYVDGHGYFPAAVVSYSFPQLVDQPTGREAYADA
jgi:hypothetical protein